jgi:tetratricopeptide (TPR) repeat protein
VTLNRLSNRETLALVTHLLGTGELGKDLEELILEKTEGIPFFVEEFIRSLRDLHIIEKKNGRYYLAKRMSDVTIPSTIQDVIMARVDSLPEGPKAILQTGAAIEREFSYELIKRVTGLPEPELLTHLSILKDSEIIDERGIYPRSTCVFRHTLTREVVYDSILSKRKKTLHGQIADAMETLYRNNLDEYYEILTEHYVRTGHFEKGAEYARLASRKAERAGSLKNAIAYSEKAIACLERLPPQEDVQKKLLDTKTKVGLYYAEMIQLDQAMKEVESVAELAKELSYKKPLPKIYSILGTYHYFVKEDFCTAFGHLEQSITISRELDDIPSLVLGNTWLGVASAFCCQFEKSLRYFEKSLDLSAQSNSLWGISIGKSNMSLFGYNWQGKLDLGLQASDEAIQFAERSGDIYSKSIAYTCHGWSHYYKGRLDEAEHYLTTASTSFEKIDVFSFWALAELCLGLIHFEKGDVSRAVEHHNKSIALFRSANIFPSFVNFNELAIQRAKALGGESGLPLEQLAEYEKANQFKIYEGWIPCLIAEILLRAKEPSLPAAEGWILKAIAADERNGMSWNLGRDYLLLAGLWERRANREEAEKNLRQAEMIFKACGAEGDLKRAESRLMASTRGA